MTGKPLVAILSGAGVSTDSGIPDYRGPNGLWRRDPEAEKLVTYEYYMADPEIRRRSWLMRRETAALHAEPNAAHRAVADLERRGVPVRVLTQNVDGLHQLAGVSARKVLELHGTARACVCTGCGARGPMADALARIEAGEDDPPCLDCGGVLKPATVMFGERLDPVVLGEAAAISKACQVFVAVGTSLQVEPAAGLAGVAVEHGARLIVVNAEPTPYDDLADEVVREPIGTALPELLRGLGSPGTEA
ncbi:MULTISPECIES: SIR2 family NAD-dependent protein deacylase [Streptomyces]|uniref:SIR2 family NAD-dependent protein deacylase n=1 Tax=Streptomyces TaxID=1883 RepID=UPI0022F1DB33|nr:Sir2 family NAD-dependent protein deacetylase [Streptomyces sp. AD681]MDA5141280.1 NAD-dependent deacetylase [Streptomyces sp. AD681]